MMKKKDHYQSKEQLNIPLRNFEMAYYNTLKINFLALSIIIAFITSGFILEKRILASQRKFANIVNLSGRQRMLSQRIAVFVGKSWGLSTKELLKENNQKIKENLSELETLVKNLSEDKSKLHLTELNHP
jgi:nitrate/nitrite-specific signal transduction histidine kinase